MDAAPLCADDDGGCRVDTIDTVPVPDGGIAVGALPVALVAGGAHTCALVHDGSAWCWGSNDDGQLGDGTARSRSWPARVAMLDRIERLSLGRAHSCAALEGGAAVCWGRNDHAQLGDTTLAARVAPSLAIGAPRARAIAAGGELAVRRRGGRRSQRRLGDRRQLLHVCFVRGWDGAMLG